MLNISVLLDIQTNLPDTSPFLSAKMTLVSTFFQMFIVLGMYNFALCLDGCESHGLSTTKLTYSYTVRQPPPSMHSARSGTTRIIWFKILIFFQVQIFSGSHKKISILYLTLLILLRSVNLQDKGTLLYEITPYY